MFPFKLNRSSYVISLEARPAPELRALANERSPWKKFARFLWCTFLILTGQLAYVTQEAIVTRCPQPVFFQYESPFTFAALALLRFVRAPPLPV